MKIEVKAIGHYDFAPKVIKVANGYVCKIEKDGSVTSTWDEKESIKTYNNKDELIEDVRVLIDNEDIFTVEPLINVDEEVEEDEERAMS